MSKCPNRSLAFLVLGAPWDYTGGDRIQEELKLTEEELDKTFALESSGS